MSTKFIFIEATGKTFNSWTVIDDSKSIWKVKCKCGKCFNVRRDFVISGKSKGCISCAQIKHGMESTLTYMTWAQLKGRCLNINNHAYKDYGGRGITVSESWMKFENFFADMGKKPKNKSIGRIDNNQGYSKENCRWETNKQQANNKRTTKIVIYNNESIALGDLCVKLNKPHRLIYKRLFRGWSLEEALNVPIMEQFIRT